jgi:hypothetical protein
MIPMGMRRAFFLSAFFLILSSLCFAQDDSLSPSFIKARGEPYIGIIHIHSNITEEGVYPFRKLVALAQARGVKILVFTDTFLKRWEYGLPFLSNIFKVSIEQRCIVKYGIKNYLKEIEKIRNEFPDMVILPGMQVSPFYWWSGSILKKNLSLNDWNKDFLVIGLESYQDYERLPVIGNRYFKPRLKDLFSLLTAVSLIIFGALFLRKGKSGKIPGWTLNILGILFLFNAFGFSASRFDAYHGQKSFLPYQDLINYTNKKKGLVFWAHPMIAQEVSSMKFLGVNLYTSAYPESLLKTTGYTGFGVNMSVSLEDNPVRAAGEWDHALKDYCLGKRNQPAWVIGEAEYISVGLIDSMQNVFFLPELNTQSVYLALRNGRFYVRAYSKNSVNISLSDFHIEDSGDKNKFGLKAFMGDKIQITDRPRLFIKGDFTNNSSGNLKIEVIRDGKIIRKFEFTNEQVFNIEFQDDSLSAYGKKSYFRLIFFTDNRIISVTNPIFIELENE